MEKRDGATTSSVLYNNEDRGAGGKFRKAPARKPSSTPYDRPPPTRDGGAGSTWWLSKLVDPATRLISGSATKLFPSFFSRLSVASPIYDGDDDDTEQTLQEAERGVDDEGPERLHDISISRSTEGVQVPLLTDESKYGPHVGERAEETVHNTAKATGILEIEQMMKGKTFSRDELQRLTELLQSKIVDQSNVDNPGKKSLDVPEGEKEEKRRIPAEENQAVHLTRVLGEVSDPLPTTTVVDPVGSSPIELAKAYMGARTSESGFGSQRVMIKDEITPLATSKSGILSPAPKSSVCWPGVMVQEQRAYLTPQIERNRVGLHNLPRTPYSRPAHSRSTSKLQGHGDESLNIMSTQRKQSQTPVYGDNQVTWTRGSPLDYGFGSVGPVRRIHRKFGAMTTPTTRTSLSRPASSSPFLAERTDASKHFSPMAKQNLESVSSTIHSIKFLPVNVDSPSSTIGVSTVHPQSSDVARKILEHLDRNIPTPQKKSEELKMATSWRKFPSSPSILNTQGIDPHLEGSESHRTGSALEIKFSDKGKEVRETSLPNTQSARSKTDDATDGVIPENLGSNTVTNEGSFRLSGVVLNSRPSMDFKKRSNFQVPGGLGENSRGQKNQSLPLAQQSEFEGQDVSKSLPSVQKKPPRQTNGSKPALSFISTGKHDPRRTVSFDNGSGFTFPVSASPGALSEPPTPSFLPFSPANSQPQKEQSTNSPSFSFGSKKTAQSLVFSFPSANSTLDNNQLSPPKYTFGSDKTRISFRSVGEDAICS